MFPPFPPDYPYGHPANPYATGNAVNPLSVFAVSDPIIQAIRAGAGALGQKPPAATAGTGAKPPAPATGGAPAPTTGPAPPPGAPPTTVGGWPGITPTPVPSPIGTTLDPTTGQPIENVTSTVSYDPTAGGGYWSSDPITGNPVWVDPNAGAPIDLGTTVPAVDTSGVGSAIDLGYGGGGGGDVNSPDFSSAY